MDPIIPQIPVVPSPTPTAPALTPNPLAHLGMFHCVDYTTKGYNFEAVVTPDQVVTAAALMDQEGFAIDAVTGMDWLAENQMEVVYDYFHPAINWRAVVRCRIPRDQPEVPTISEVFPGANWHEREAWEFFGIRFAGHPNLEPLLLPEDADYHPLRKDFVAA